MAKLIYQAKDRTPVNQNGSIYLLLEEPLRKVMGIDENSEMAVELYWSEKHRDHYLAVYKRSKKEDAPTTNNCALPLPDGQPE